MRKAIACSAALAVFVAAGTSAGRAQTPSCPAALPAELASTGSTTQLVTVVAPRRTSTRGSLTLWERAGGCWTRVAGPWSAWLGRRGVSEQRHEGDATTPAGRFAFGPVMYGVAPNPGVRFPYRRIVCGDWWVEDPRSPSYNRLRHVRCGVRPPFRVTTPDMSHSPTAYRHLAVIEFNVDPVVPGRGSGIFLHASLGKPTSGCVSLPLPELLVVLRRLRPASAPAIVIGTAARIRAY